MQLCVYTLAALMHIWIFARLHPYCIWTDSWLVQGQQEHCPIAAFLRVWGTYTVLQIHSPTNFETPILFSKSCWKVIKWKFVAMNNPFPNSRKLFTASLLHILACNVYNAIMLVNAPLCLMGRKSSLGLALLLCKSNVAAIELCLSVPSEPSSHFPLLHNKSIHCTFKFGFLLPILPKDAIWLSELKYCTVQVAVGISCCLLIKAASRSFSSLFLLYFCGCFKCLCRTDIQTLVFLNSCWKSNANKTH